ncbi:MAG: PAS domain S-box protein [Candidatus Krumholzibacteriota bacterium]|nr:PAS domain S-box protein [Candidatus Krumholzibacteriota bacterium]
MDELSVEGLRAEIARLEARVRELEEGAPPDAFWKNVGDWERNLFGRLMQTSRYGIVVDDRDGRIVSANAGAVSMLGLAKKEPGASRYDEPGWVYADYDGRPLLPEETPFGRVSSSGEAFVGVRNAVQWPDGRRILLSINCAPLFDRQGEVDGVVTIFENVTKQVLADEALRDSEERFRLMAENISDGLSVIESGRIVWVNERLVEILGYPRERLMEMTGLDIAAPEERPRLDAAEAAVRGGNPPPRDLEFWIVRGNGERRYIHNRYSTTVAADGTPRRYVVTTDRTRRKLAEDEIRRSEERYRSIFDTAAHLVVAVDEEGIVRDCNARVTEVLGYTKDELIGRGCHELIHEEDRLEDGEPIDLMRAGDRVWGYECRMINKDGDVRHVKINTSVARDGHGTFLQGICIIEDVTEHRQLEEMLFQSRKMEAIGKLAGGIAHDFNNLLTAIGGYSDLLLMGLAGDDERREDVEEIRRAADRAATLTRRLLAFSRRQEIRPRVIDLNRTVAELERMLGRLIGEHIDMVTALASDLHPVKADPGQIEQVIMNLAINASDAMPGGGKLFIGTENVELGGEDAWGIPDVRPGSYVCLTVEDTGEGMDEETRQSAFEPFFSTRRESGGSGLGLSTVYGIVRRHDGAIRIFSEPGAGTSVRVFLPAAGNEADVAGEESFSYISVQGAGERILVVEDDEGVRDFTVRALSENGYLAVGSASAEEALDRFLRDGEAFDLVLSDVVLPGRSGNELAVRLLAAEHAPRVLLSSGYPSGAAGPRGSAGALCGFIQKPYTVATLLRRIREELDAGGGPPERPGHDSDGGN